VTIRRRAAVVPPVEAVRMVNFVGENHRGVWFRAPPVPVPKGITDQVLHGSDGYPQEAADVRLRRDRHRPARAGPDRVGGPGASTVIATRFAGYPDGGVVFGMEGCTGRRYVAEELARRLKYKLRVCMQSICAPSRTGTCDTRFRKPVDTHLCVERRNTQPAYQRIPTSAIACQRVPTTARSRSRRPVEHTWSTRDHADDRSADQCQAIPTAANRCQPLPTAANHSPNTVRTTPGYSA
jgi:hypothetical protein